jgi:protein O-mannosyl-transferase
MALLSKEYAITLVILLPLSLYLFNGNSIKKSITTFLPFFGAIAVYMLLRLHTSASANESSDNEVLNNPYLFASYNEEFATKIATAFNYIKLLVWPHPLSADYSYNSIPYKDFDSPWVWLSLVVYAGLAFIMFRFFPKKPPTVYQPSAKRQHLAQTNYRSILCFAIAFYLLNFLLICNWIFNIGGTMGERLIYHSSVGFAIAAGYLIYSGFDRLRPRRTAMILLSIFMVLMVLLSGYKTITRNAEWKNNETLFYADIKTVPNSVIVLGNLVNSLIDNADLLTDSIARRASLNKAVNLATRAIEIDPVYVAGFFNRGLALFKLGEIDKSRANMDSVKAHYYNYPALPSMYKTISLAYMKKGIDPYAKNGRWTEALSEFRKGLAIDSTNAELWFNTGVALYAVHDASGAINAWQTTLRLNPAYGPAKQDLNFALQQVSQNNTGK